MQCRLERVKIGLAAVLVLVRMSGHIASHADEAPPVIRIDKDWKVVLDRPGTEVDAG